MAAGRRSRRELVGLVGLALVAALWWWLSPGSDDVAPAGPSASSSATDGASDSASVAPTRDADGLQVVAVTDLPAQAARTLDLIEAGGPFPYPGRDGSTFGNLERLLPMRARGYYREYTVPTPGSRDRGARRIIAGSGGERYWTADHYASFARIAVDGSGAGGGR